MLLTLRVPLAKALFRVSLHMVQASTLAIHGMHRALLHSDIRAGSSRIGQKLMPQRAFCRDALGTVQTQQLLAQLHRIVHRFDMSLGLITGGICVRGSVEVRIELENDSRDVDWRTVKGRDIAGYRTV